MRAIKGKRKLFNQSAHGGEWISSEITNPKRVYLAACNLTSHVLSARERALPTFPTFT